MRSPLKVATRLAVTAAVGLSLAAVVSSPAHAGSYVESAGYNYPDYGSCMNAASTAQRNRHGDDHYCTYDPADRRYDAWVVFYF